MLVGGGIGGSALRPRSFSIQLASIHDIRKFGGLFDSGALNGGRRALGRWRVLDQAGMFAKRRSRSVGPVVGTFEVCTIQDYPKSCAGMRAVIFSWR